ncbi:helix-turn-helix transcriptional regulator [Streptomyces fumanus]|uniref:helix-turn-helix transcriptional regulator n=1 Tax=Streptomyces fumanus TaxID=67302 RepID=UPI0033E97D4C
MLDGALTGEGAIATVCGAVAMGRTTLLADFTRRVRAAGGLALPAVASESEENIPLGVIAQLLAEAPLSESAREQADQLLAHGRAHMTGMPDAPVTRLSAVDAQIVHHLSLLLLGLAPARPVAIVVDDIHHADVASLTCLAYLGRRIRNTAVVAVFSHSDGPGDRCAGFVEQLLRLPHARGIRLTPLDAEQVREVVTDRLGEDCAQWAAGWALRVSGGNPLLLDGALNDVQGAGQSSTGYQRAFLSCLRRTPAPATQVVRALAVLGAPERISRLLGLEAGEVAHCLATLEAAGLLSQGAFRHPDAAAAVLADLGPEATAALQREAAELTYAEGCSASVVAAHLLAGEGVRAPWAMSVLDSAAATVLAEGRPATAAEYLRLACRLSEDKGELARIRAALLLAERRLGTTVPEQRVTDLVQAVRTGRLSGGETLGVVRALLWSGRVRAAEDVLRHLAASDRAATADTPLELDAARLWLRCSYAPLLELLPDGTDDTDDGQEPSGVPSTTESRRRYNAVSALESVLTPGPSDRAVPKAEQVLHGSRLHGTDLDTIECALLTLTYADRPALASPHCDELISSAESRGERGSAARLHAVRAEICVRLGDLAGAVRHASAWFDLVPPDEWGMAVGAPLASKLIALTAMGREDEATELLYVPTQEAMLQSRPGLHYLHARGRYSLAMRDWHSALSDFQHCGELMARWGVDVPGLIAWRNDVGETLLGMGERDRARAVLEEQARCTERGGSPRTRGATLRLLAATYEPRKRLVLLRQAVDALQESGDRYELARTLADLTDTYHAVGETRRARVIGSQARIVADACEAEPLSRLLPSDGERPDTESPAPGVVLTDAEQRVADLVALGHTNSEIAKMLYITVSTVEQHLTRMYRRMGVNDRTQLATSLFTGAHRETVKA